MEASESAPTTVEALRQRLRVVRREVELVERERAELLQSLKRHVPHAQPLRALEDALAEQRLHRTSAMRDAVGAALCLASTAPPLAARTADNLLAALATLPRAHPHFSGTHVVAACPAAGAQKNSTGTDACRPALHGSGEAAGDSSCAPKLGSGGGLGVQPAAAAAAAAAAACGAGRAANADSLPALAAPGAAGPGVARFRKRAPSRLVIPNGVGAAPPVLASAPPATQTLDAVRLLEPSEEAAAAAALPLSARSTRSAVSSSSC